MYSEFPDPHRNIMDEIGTQVDLGNCSTCPRIGKLAASLQARLDHNVILTKEIVGEDQPPASAAEARAKALLDVIFPDLIPRPREMRTTERVGVSDRLDADIQQAISQVAAMVARCPGVNNLECGLTQTDNARPMQ